MKHNRLIIFFTGFGLLVSGIVTPVDAAIVHPQITSSASVVADLKTGQVIAEKNGTKRLPIASVSKLIVIYMVEQAITNGKLSPNQQVKVPTDIAKFSEDTSVVNIPLSTDKPYTVAQLEQAALITSSNSAAMLLANLVSGSQENYYKDAQKLLKSWNIKNAKIYSSSGLKDGDLDAFNDNNVNDDKENVLSAREVALIAKKLVDKFPDITKITSKKETDFPDKDGKLQTIKSTDELLSNKDYMFVGLKTGVTPANGGNFVGITKIDDEPVITVILNSGKDNPDQTKFDDTIKVLNDVKKNTTIKNIDEKTSYQFIKAATKNGKVNLVASTDKKVFVSRNNDMKLVSKLRFNKKLSLPFSKDQVIATKELKLSENDANDYLEENSEKVDYKVVKNISKTNDLLVEGRFFMNLFK